MNKELEQRGLYFAFACYADDYNIFVKSKMSANRVMRSVSSWLERKLFLKANATKTKVVRPANSNFLGFTFWKGRQNWQAKPADDRKSKVYTGLECFYAVKEQLLCPLTLTFTNVNQVVRS